MRLVNIAHGNFIVLGTYLALIIVVPVRAVLGYAIQRGLLNRTLWPNMLPPILVTFGLAVVIQNTLLTAFWTGTRRLAAGGIETASLSLGPIAVGWLPLATFLVAVGIIVALELLFYKTAIGRAFCATSDDPESARAIGVDTRHVHALAMALGFAVIAVAGVFLAVRSNFDPFSRATRLIYGFEAVIIGGLGSLWGALAGGIVLGVAPALGAQIWPSMQILAGRLVFFLILAVRPRGLFPQMD